MRATTSAGSLWNGPICPTCGARYLGSHRCSRDDIMRRINELMALLPGAQAPSAPGAGGNNCPCRPENGGSGICGCVLGGPQITCSVQP